MQWQRYSREKEVKTLNQPYDRKIVLSTSQKLKQSVVAQLEASKKLLKNLVSRKMCSLCKAIVITRKRMYMFNFLRSKRAQKNRHSMMDLYELNEQETEMLMGGSPVRYLIGGRGNNVSPWQQSTNMGSGGANYQPYNATPFQDRWQQAPSWVQIGEENRTRWPKRYE